MLHELCTPACARRHVFARAHPPVAANKWWSVPQDVANARCSRAEGTNTGVTLAPVPANTPQPVLQFTKLNIQIINSQFSDLVGTPYTLIFNDSLVEFINTTFTSNTGAPPRLSMAGPAAAVTIGPGSLLPRSTTYNSNSEKTRLDLTAVDAGSPEGVLHGFSSFFTFTNCTFMGNHGRQTGVMNIENGDATFDSCQFINNQGDQVSSGMRAVIASLCHGGCLDPVSICTRCHPSGTPLSLHAKVVMCFGGIPSLCTGGSAFGHGHAVGFALGCCISRLPTARCLDARRLPPARL